MAVMILWLRCNPVTCRICGAPKANGGYVAMVSPSCSFVMGWKRVLPKVRYLAVHCYTV
jgi:hypothetical protein